MIHAAMLKQCYINMNQPQASQGMNDYLSPIQVLYREIERVDVAIKQKEASIAIKEAKCAFYMQEAEVLRDV